VDLKLEKTIEDVRGKIVFFSYGNKQINVIEIRKGYSRGGHYHEVSTSHTILVGKLEYKEKDIETGKEFTKILSAPTKIDTRPKCAHLLTALEDTIFIEAFEKPYKAINFPEYRDIVENKKSLQEKV